MPTTVPARTAAAAPAGSLDDSLDDSVERSRPPPAAVSSIRRVTVLDPYF
ncbi:MAG: hypothetical protein ABI894_09385 [Ilumatobacteraceae bacterium]